MIKYKTPSGEIERLTCFMIKVGKIVFASNRFQIQDGQVYDQKHRRVGVVVSVDA